MTNIFQISFCFQIQSVFFQSAFYKVYLAFRVYLSVFDVFLLLHCYRHQKSGWSMVSWKVGWSSWQKGMSRLLGSFHLSSFYQDITLHLRQCSVSFWKTSRMYFYFSLFLRDYQDLLWYGWLYPYMFSPILSSTPYFQWIFDFRTFHWSQSQKKWWMKGRETSRVNTLKSLQCHFSEKWDGKSVHCHLPSPENRLLWTLKQIGINSDLISLS